MEHPVDHATESHDEKRSRALGQLDYHMQHILK